MAIVGISEFTFGYAFLYEQTVKNWGDLQAAPVLPSLQQEATAGWDARLPLTGIDYYYQFKLSDYLSRGNAKFIANGTYAGPYYRISLHRRDNNRQHGRLRELAAAHPNVYYVAPEFNTLDDFNGAFLGGQIMDRSRLIPLQQCKDLTDGKQHYITFQPNATSWSEHSERTFHEVSFTGRQLPELYAATRSEWKPIDTSFAQGVFERVYGASLEAIRREDGQLSPAAILDGPTPRERNELLLRASQIVSVVFGAALVIVGGGDATAS